MKQKQNKTVDDEGDDGPLDEGVLNLNVRAQYGLHASRGNSSSPKMLSKKQSVWSASLLPADNKHASSTFLTDLNEAVGQTKLGSLSKSKEVEETGAQKLLQDLMIANQMCSSLVSSKEDLIRDARLIEPNVREFLYVPSNYVRTLARCRVKDLVSPIKFGLEYLGDNSLKPDVRICCSFT